MDNSLKERSEYLDSVRKDLVEASMRDLKSIDERIEVLTTKLKDKEMHSDRSENADFQITKDERDIQTYIRNLIQNRIEALLEMDNAYVPTGVIMLGTTVELTLLDINRDTAIDARVKSLVIKIVNHEASKADVGLVAIDSKVGAALCYHKAGDIVSVIAPKGAISYRIERIY